MDGNGRWAASRGWPRVTGHRAGAEAVRRTVEAAVASSVPLLTLYAFSSDNWNRPPEEVTALMRLFGEFLQTETAECVRNGVRLNVIGRRDRLDPALVATIETAEKMTASGAMLLRLAVDYSAREAIARAASMHQGGALSREGFRGLMASAVSATAPVPDVDLLVRTGGERRLSDFLLWELAYAELYFTEVMWPDFDGAELGRAMDYFAARERRFGRIPA